MTKLEREWTNRLNASGFHDLEGPNRDGPLSDKGNLHPVAETPEERERLEARIGDGNAFTSWANDVLYNVHFASEEQREVWRLHAEGTGEREIATTLTITRGKVRIHLAETRAKVSKVSKVKRWRNQKRQGVAQLRSLVRNCDPEILTTLVALMMRPAPNRRVTPPSP